MTRVKRMKQERSRTTSIFLLVIASCIGVLVTNLQKVKDADKYTNNVNKFEAKLNDASRTEGMLKNPIEMLDNPIVRVNNDPLCADYDFGDTTPAANVTSIFNCGSEEGRCYWYFPARFFNEECGIGKEFQSELEYMERLHKERKLWPNGPPIVIPWASISPRVDSGTFRNGEPFPMHNLSMTHVHKTGGTSLVVAFSKLASKPGAKGKRHTLYMPPRVAKPPKLKKVPEVDPRPAELKAAKQVTAFGKGFKETTAFLDGAVKYTNNWGEKDHTLFAVIRDPAERFISAIGQATGAYGSSTNGVAKFLVQECVKSTSKASLKCFVNLIKTNSTWLEMHFTPMALEISFATAYKDIPVAVFPFTEVPSLMRELGSNPHEVKKDGHKDGYRKSPVLTNMTMASYDDDTLRDLCELYKVDVLFMQHLGYPCHCDPFIPIGNR